MLTPTANSLVQALAQIQPGQVASQSTQTNKTLQPIIPLPAIPFRVGVGAPTLN